MPTITLDEARQRFGDLVHKPSRTHREFADPEGGGIWRPVFLEGELTGYRLYQLHKVAKKTSWRNRR